MQRRLEITVPSEQTDALLRDVRGMSGVLSLRVERGISERPKGDLITVEALTRTETELMRLLEHTGVGKSSSSSISISEASAVISPTVKQALSRESNVLGWEPIQAVIAKTSNMTLYALITMFVAGAISAVGISTGALHVAVGGFIIAPGFEPIVRTPLGLIAKSPAWHRGIRDTLLGYLALIAGAFVAALIVKTTTAPLLSGASAYFPVDPLISFWTSLTVPSALVAITGGLVGAVLIATGRAILTAGVVVALALVPASTIVGIALAAGDFEMVLNALSRFAAEVGMVLVGSVPVWLWWRAREQKRPSML